MGVTSNFPAAWQDGSVPERGSTMKKFLILTALALAILGGTATITMLVPYPTVIADCGTSDC